MPLMQEFDAVLLDYDKPRNTTQHNLLIIKDNAASAGAVDNGLIRCEGCNFIAVQHAGRIDAARIGNRCGHHGRIFLSGSFTGFGLLSGFIFRWRAGRWRG